MNESYDDNHNEEEELEREFCKSALPVSGPPLPPSDEPPLDADEYLRRVQYERMQCAVTVSKDIEQDDQQISDDAYASHDIVSKCARMDSEATPGNYPVSDEWRQQILQWFRETRDHCQGYALHVNDGEDRQTVVFDRDQDLNVQLARADTRSLVKLLRTLVQEPVLDKEWVFGVLSFLDTPLLADTMCLLQELRRALYKELERETDEAKASEGHTIHIVIRDYFGQR